MPKTQKEMSNSERIEKINELKFEIMKEKGQSVVGGSVTNPGKIKQTKKMIAKLMTAINKK